MASSAMFLQSQVEEKQQEIMRLSQSQAPAPERFTCFECKGARFNQQRVTCKVCNGSGYLSDHQNAKLQACIKEYIDISMPAAYMKLTQSAAQIDEPSVDYDEKARRRF